MAESTRHPFAPAVSFDGGDLDCGSGLLLLIRKHIDPLPSGQLLEILSTDSSVEEDLPSWCRLTGNQMVSRWKDGRQSSYLVSKGTFAGATAVEAAPPGGAKRRTREHAPLPRPVVAIRPASVLPPPSPAPAIEPLSVMGIGSWPRPKWLLKALHEHLEGRLSDADFNETADDAVRLAVEAQLRASVDVLSDGEQRRDNYASFVGGLLENCQLVPITDLLSYVDDPEEFERELRALDVPASDIRHPAVFGPLGRNRPLAGHEAAFVATLSPKPVKVALPGPYLLTRTMWMECISDRAYANREDLAVDIVRVLREETHHLVAAGVALVQFDEPVLSEVVFGQPSGSRTFMCGALGAKGPAEEELAFAQSLLNQVVAGLPRERVALHICRGNWTPDESVALAGDYAPLLDLLANVDVGTLFLELCTPRAGDIAVLRDLPRNLRVGAGVVNQKHAAIESVPEIVERAERAIAILGADRVLLNPDCGFATFADNPIASAAVAEAKLAAIVGAAKELRARHFGR